MARRNETKTANAPVPARDYEARERTYRARDALRTLTEADTIRRDKTLMRDVKAEAKKVMRTVQTSPRTKK